MDKNVGGSDRTVRVIAGIILVVLALLGFAGTLGLSTTLNVVLIVVGAVLLITGWAQICPLNKVFGINTFRGKSGSSPEEPT